MRPSRHLTSGNSQLIKQTLPVLKRDFSSSSYSERPAGNRRLLPKLNKHLDNPHTFYHLSRASHLSTVKFCYYCADKVFYLSINGLHVYAQNHTLYIKTSRHEKSTLCEVDSVSGVYYLLNKIEPDAEICYHNWSTLSEYQTS